MAVSMMFMARPQCSDRPGSTGRAGLPLDRFCGRRDIFATEKDHSMTADAIIAGREHRFASLELKTLSEAGIFTGYASLFGEVDLELRSLGFIPHMFTAINKKMIAPMLGPNPAAAMNQLVEADVVYIKDFIKAEAMD
eukprot:gene56324-77196_t